MSEWSKHPPRRACYAYFHGTRRTAHNQTVRVDAPVEVREVCVARVTGLAVALTGNARWYPVDRFSGLWLPLLDVT